MGIPEKRTIIHLVMYLLNKDNNAEQLTVIVPLALGFGILYLYNY
jgi:hypothetical protein